MEEMTLESMYEKLVKFMQDNPVRQTQNKEGNLFGNIEPFKKLNDIDEMLRYLAYYSEALIYQTGKLEEEGLVDLGVYEPTSAVLEKEDKDIPVSVKVGLNSLLVPAVRLMYFNRTNDLAIGVSGVIHPKVATFINLHASHEDIPDENEALSKEEVEESLKDDGAKQLEEEAVQTVQ